MSYVQELIPVSVGFEVQAVPILSRLLDVSEEEKYKADDDIQRRQPLVPAVPQQRVRKAERLYNLD